VHTVDEIIEKFRKERLPRLRKRTQKDYGRHLDVLSRHFGEREAKELTLKELNSWMDVETGKIHRNRQMAVMSSLLGAAVKWGWLDSNVAKEVQRNATKARDRIVTDKELAQAKEHASKRLQLAMDLSLLSGLKQGAIITLTWAQVDRNENLIRIRHHSTGRQVQIPITPELDAVLVRCKELTNKKRSDFVLPSRSGDPYTSEGFRAVWQRAMQRYQKTGNDRFTFQDIQKTWASRKKSTELRGGSDLEKVFQDYPYFDRAFRREATEMAPYYEVFYCLEQSIRKLVIDTLHDAVGKDWWESDKIQASIRQEVAALVVKEVDSAIRQRSLRMIDYTTFGQLTSIILQNWDLFVDVFTSKNAVARVLTALNLQRGPIAHCCRMSEEEVERLRLLVRDWFETLHKRPQAA
jgi:integrase